MCDHNFARFEEKIVLFFGVNHNSVPQKLRILAIKAIFDPKNSSFTNVIDDKAKLLLLKLIHLFAREVSLVKKFGIEETKTT